MITRADALRMAQEKSSDGWSGDAFVMGPVQVADLIMETQRATAEECGHIADTAVRKWGHNADPQNAIRAALEATRDV